MKFNNACQCYKNILLVAALTLVVGPAILPIRASAQIIVVPTKSDLRVQIVIQTALNTYQQVNVPSGTVVSAPPSSPSSMINCPATGGVAIPTTPDCSETGIASNTSIKLVATTPLIPNALFYQWKDIPGSIGLPISNSCTPASSSITCTMAGARNIMAVYKCKDNFSYDSASKQCKPPAGTGRITIVKDAQPNDAQDFTFTHNVPGILPFQLDDDPTDNTRDNSKIFTNLPAGSYTFTEGLVSGWNVTGIVCTSSLGTTTTSNTTTRTATINLAAGANATCTFTNVKPPTQTACSVFVPGRTSCGLDLQIKRAKVGTANYQVTVSPAAILPSPNTTPNSTSICVNTSLVLQTGCVYFYSTSPTAVTLTASSSGSMPVGFSWSGGPCNGSNPTCTFNVTNAGTPLNVVANFPQ